MTKMSKKDQMEQKERERRNSRLNEACVRGNADFSHLKTLDERVDAMVENRNNTFIHNVEYILKTRNISQARMCNIDLEGLPQPPQMASYKKVGKDIPYRTIVRVGTAYGYTPEELTGQLLDQQDSAGFAADKLSARPSDEYKKYIGTYHLGYFSVDAKLGSNKRSTARALASGMLSIYPGNAVSGVPTLRAVAFVNCTEEEQETLLKTARNAEMQGRGKGVRACYEKVAAAQQEGSYETPRMKCFYEGEMTLTDRIAEITLRQVRGSDTIHIALHNRAANSSEGSAYKGGLATMMSISRGEEHMPCVQAVVLSRRGFAHIAKEELAGKLYLGAPEINLQKETREIVKCMKALYFGEGGDTQIPDIDDSYKAFMLESAIEKMLLEVIKRNVLSYYKISIEEDSDIYKTICR